jgi:hypothetical protein
MPAEHARRRPIAVRSAARSSERPAARGIGRKGWRAQRRAGKPTTVVPGVPARGKLGGSARGCRRSTRGAGRRPPHRPATRARGGLEQWPPYHAISGHYCYMKTCNGGHRTPTHQATGPPGRARLCAGTRPPPAHLPQTVTRRAGNVPGVPTRGWPGGSARMPAELARRRPVHVRSAARSSERPLRPWDRTQRAACLALPTRGTILPGVPTRGWPGGSARMPAELARRRPVHVRSAARSSERPRRPWDRTERVACLALNSYPRHDRAGRPYARAAGRIGADAGADLARRRPTTAASASRSYGGGVQEGPQVSARLRLNSHRAWLASPP